MDKFCRTCGSPIDQTTGKCPQCAPLTTPPAQAAVDPGAENTAFNAERIKAENAVKRAEEKAKKKEEKKQAWALAKKRYKEDVSAKKAVIKKAKKEKFTKLSSGQKLARVSVKLVILLVLVGLVAGGVYFAIKQLVPSDNNQGSGGGKGTTTTGGTTTTTPVTKPSGSIGTFNPPQDDMPDDYEVPPVDADAFFGENAEIVAEIPAATAGRTEAEAYANLTGRGFTMAPIEAEYDMNGTLGDLKEIAANGTDKHPIYTTYFLSDTGDVWSVFEINGAVMAIPLSYNTEYMPNVQVAFSETDTVTSYDSVLNKFYVTKPFETALDVKVVTRIDAATLNTISAWEIAYYE